MNWGGLSIYIMKGLVTGLLLTVLWNKISANSHIYFLQINQNAVNAVEISEGDARNSCLEKEAHLCFSSNHLAATDVSHAVPPPRSPEPDARVRSPHVRDIL